MVKIYIVINCVLGINLNSKILTTLRKFEQFVQKRTYYNIFPNWKLGYYFSIFESLEHVIFLEEQAALLKQW